MIQNILHAELDAPLNDIHIIIQISDGDFRLDHPELTRVTRGVALRSPESRTESVDVLKGHRKGFDVELPRNGEARPPAIEIVDRIFGVGRHGEDLARSFGIVRGDFRRMDINETIVLEEGMNRHGQNRANPIKGIEGVGSRTEISLIAEILESGPFLLKRIILGDIA